MISMKKLRFSSRPRTKVRRHGPPDSARAQPVSGRFAYGSFRLRSVRLRIESIRLRLICQFAYESDVEALKLNY